MRIRLSLSICLAALFLVMAASSVCADSAPAATLYERGDVIPDQTFRLVNGTDLTLYSLFDDHDAVLLNFFATWCEPCRSEMKYLNEAYEEYSDDVAILAVSADTADTEEMLRDYAAEQKMEFPVALASQGLVMSFGFSAIPFSVMIDRNKVMCFSQTGAFTSSMPIRLMFRDFSSDRYSESVPGYEIPAATAADYGIDLLSSEDFRKILSPGSSEVAFSNTSDPSRFPFVADEAGGICPSNAQIPGTTAEINAKVKAAAGDVLSFTWEMNAAMMLEDAVVYIDGIPVKTITGVKEKSDFVWKFETAGEHSVRVFFETHAYDEPDPAHFLRIENVRLLRGADAAKALESQAVYPKTLSGDAYELTPAGEGVREAVVTVGGQEDAIRKYFVAGSDGITVRLAIGDAVDPDSVVVLLESGTTGYHCLTEFETDEEGFLIPLDLLSLKDGIPYNILQVFTRNGTMYGPGALFCVSGEDMDATMGYLSVEQQAEWRYADDAAESSVSGAEAAEDLMSEAPEAAEDVMSEASALEKD